MATDEQGPKDRVVSLFEYARENLPQEIRERLSRIESINNSLHGDERLLELYLAQSEFNQKLIADVLNSNFKEDPKNLGLARLMLLNSAVYAELIGGSDYIKGWRLKSFDLVKPAEEYIYSQQEVVGIVEASYLLNAKELGIINEVSGIPEEIVNLFHTISNIEVNADPLPSISF